MRHIGLAAWALAVGLAAPRFAIAEDLPAWAYPVNPPGAAVEEVDAGPRRVPDSDITLRLAQVRDMFAAPDWHPGDHPPMPAVVARGRAPSLYACAYCHRADGPGGPENANLTGLSVDYIIEQLAAFRDGARKTSEPKRAFVGLMAQVARAATDQEARDAAGYFASVPYHSMVDVVEAATVPKTIVKDWHMALAPGGGTEPIGARIIEIPDDPDRFVSRDARVRFTAYVPPGSIAKGEALAASGDSGRSVPCGICHGPDLKGMGPAPAIIGRSPSYVARQLFDMKAGNRTGGNAALMQPVVEKLTVDDMLALAAYTASLKP
jgi:cytochrome c553